MDVDRPIGLSAVALGVLREGIGLVFSQWWAFQMAVQNEWGGPDSLRKADQLASDVFSWFSQSKEPLYIDDLENMLHQALESLNTWAEDGSVEEVAEKLMIMHEECLEGNFKSIESLRKVSVHHVRQVANDDDDDDDNNDNVGVDDANKNDVLSDMMLDDSSNMVLDAPESLSNSTSIDMPVDASRPKATTEAEDGWVQVACRRNKVFVNGKFCKDPKVATANDFFFSGLNIPTSTANPLGSNVTLLNADNLLGLNTLGVSFARIDFAPYGVVPPHTHPHATEILVVVEGTLYVGFVTSNLDNRLFTKVLNAGDVFIFPIGLIHFQFNIGNSNAVSFSGLDSQNPGLIVIANNVFGSTPPINPDVLTKAF